MIRPTQLRPGDKVALISPASPPDGRRTLMLGKKRLEQLGLRVATGKHALAEYGYLAGTDGERLRDLEAAFRDRSVKAIFCARGGYGLSRLVTAFDPLLFAAHPKALVGFSDITILHLALQQAGVVSFWGPMPSTSLWSDFSARWLQKALMSGEPLGRLPLAGRRRPAPLRPGTAKGPLTGGTISLLTASLGTPCEVDTGGRIVFLEDVDEEPYRVDRMLAQLVAAGKLADAAGIALGDFTPPKTRNCPGKRTLTMQQVFGDHLLPLKVPVMRGLAVGHIADQFTLPYGVEARMDAGAGTIEVLEPGVAAAPGSRLTAQSRSSRVLTSRAGRRARL